jgi:6-phosphogluconolactonase
MKTRREFLLAAGTVAAGAAASQTMWAQHGKEKGHAMKQRVFVASGAKDGILAFDWDGGRGELEPAGRAAELEIVDWLALSQDKKYLYAACEVESFNGRATGMLASFAVEGGKLRPLSARNSASKGTCHCAVDATGTVLLAADYGGGSAASFAINSGVLSEVVWSEHYTSTGPNKERQEAAHAHFAGFSPDNRFAYFNDLGGDVIHIYAVDMATAKLTKAGDYKSAAGAGPRTLRFHPNGKVGYSVNELNSTLDVLAWSKADGGLSLIERHELLAADSTAPRWACDTVITRDGRFVYVAHRGDDFILSMKADMETGRLTPMERTPAGGKIPRSFTLDPTEKWVLVANQKSDYVSVFARDEKTGLIAKTGKNFALVTPMSIVFI